MTCAQSPNDLKLSDSAGCNAGRSLALWSSVWVGVSGRNGRSGEPTGGISGVVGRDCGRLSGGVRCSAWLGVGSLSWRHYTDCLSGRKPPPAHSLSATRRASPKALHPLDAARSGVSFFKPREEAAPHPKRAVAPRPSWCPRFWRDRPGQVGSHGRRGLARQRPKTLRFSVLRSLRRIQKYM